MTLALLSFFTWPIDQQNYGSGTLENSADPPIRLLKDHPPQEMLQKSRRSVTYSTTQRTMSTEVAPEKARSEGVSAPFEIITPRKTGRASDSPMSDTSPEVSKNETQSSDSSQPRPSFRGSFPSPVARPCSIRSWIKTWFREHSVKQPAWNQMYMLAWNGEELRKINQRNAYGDLKRWGVQDPYARMIAEEIMICRQVSCSYYAILC